MWKAFVKMEDFHLTLLLSITCSVIYSIHFIQQGIPVILELESQVNSVTVTKTLLN